MSAATVVVSSAEGAGDMPSSVPVASDDTSQEGGPLFSEVLSRSSSDAPGPPDAPDSPDPSGDSPEASPPPEPSLASDEGHVQTDTAAPAVPPSPAKGGADPSLERGQRRAGPPERAVAPSGCSVGSPPPSAAETATPVSAPDSAPIRTGDAATETAGNPGGAPAPTSASTTSLASEPSAALTAVSASAASEGSPVAAVLPGTRSETDGPQAPGPSETWATAISRVLDAGTAAEGVGLTQAPTDAAQIGHTAVRGSGDTGVAPGSVLLRAGTVRNEASGSTPSVTASALSASAVTAPGTGTSRSSDVLLQDGSAVTAFPDADEGVAAPGLDIGDLAASISRPLAAGSGDYSVQVSLHPPELGQVRALLSLQGDVLHVTLTPEHSSGFDALSDALPTLHDQLAGGGVEVHVSLGQPGEQHGGDAQAGAEAGSAATTPSDDTGRTLALSAVPTGSGDPGRIHLIL